MISWHSKQIAIKQLMVQKDIIETELLRVELNMSPESNAEVFNLREELRFTIKMIEVALKQTQEITCRPKRFWSQWIVNIYDRS